MVASRVVSRIKEWTLTTFLKYRIQIYILLQFGGSFATWDFSLILILSLVILYLSVVLSFLSYLKDFDEEVSSFFSVLSELLEDLKILVLASSTSWYIGNLEDHWSKYTYKSSIAVLIDTNSLPSPWRHLRTSSLLVIQRLVPFKLDWNGIALAV